MDKIKDGGRGESNAEESRRKITGRGSLVLAVTSQTAIVRDIVKRSIETVYPRFYPQGAVEFFLGLHGEAQILEAIQNQNVYLFETEAGYVGTGSAEGSHLYRLFVHPDHLREGVGTAIMDRLEEIAFADHESVCLDASLPAIEMYLKRGYQMVEYHQVSMPNGNYLCYPVMEKRR